MSRFRINSSCLPRVHVAHSLNLGRYLVRRIYVHRENGIVDLDSDRSNFTGLLDRLVNERQIPFARPAFARGAVSRIGITQPDMFADVTLIRVCINHSHVRIVHR